MGKTQLKALAVGASGSIGRFVVASALNHGHAVRALFATQAAESVSHREWKSSWGI